ncbi:MAG: LamG domain-containing protein, partial [Planctomycetota bacterium]
MRVKQVVTAIGILLVLGGEIAKSADQGTIPLHQEAEFLPPAVLADAEVSATTHPLHDKINLFGRRQGDFESFKPTGLSREDYLQVIAGQVRVMRGYQNAAGRIVDPVRREEVYYATPCFTHCVAALVASGHDRDPKLLESGMKAMDAAVRDMARGEARNGHGDFYTYPVMMAYALYSKVVPPERLAEWRNKLKQIDRAKLYRARSSGNNWNVVNLSGEYLRAVQGFTGMDYTENCLVVQLPHFTELGMYDEHGHPLPYDHFPRHYLAGILHKGYRGKSFGIYRDLLWKGAWVSLFMQSPFGELPTGYRSSHHIWNEAESAVTYEIYASHYARAGREAEAGAFKRAAMLSLACIKNWIRPDGSGYIVKNRYPIEARHGYEVYSAHANYNMLACSMLSAAWEFADDSIAEKPCPADIGGFVVPILKPYHKVFANTGGTYVEYDTNGDHIYNPTGLIRVHVKGGHPQLGPSDGCAPKYSGNNVNLSIGPAWEDHNGEWHRLADISPTVQKVEILEESPQRAKFRIVYKPVTIPGLTDDASGKDNPALVRDIKPVKGQQKKAFSFARGRAAVFSKKPIDFGGGDFSISLWFKATHSKGRQDLLGATVAGKHSLLIELNERTLRFLYRCPPGNRGGSETNYKMGKEMVGSWHHVVAMKKGAGLLLYLDGKRVGSAKNKKHLEGAFNVVLGNLHKHKSERHFSGSIDDVRIYDQSLPETEIESLYERTLAGAKIVHDMLAHWPLDEVLESSSIDVVETITVEPGGVTVESKLGGEDIRAMRIYYPMLVFD